MKPLDQYPTPENQLLADAMNGSDDATHLVALDALSCDLERRNAALREFAREVFVTSSRMGLTTLALEVLTLTAPKP